MSGTKIETTSHLSACWTCKQSFETMDTAFCACLTTEPSLVCTACLECFCRAPDYVKKAFWSEAPDVLWDRKFEQMRRSYQPKPNLDPGKAVRPLVLVVDPAKNVQRMAARVLTELGFGMILAVDGNEGFSLAGQYKPDVVLTEAFIPGLDGREMGRRLKNDPVTGGIKVVVMTSLYRSAAHKHEALREFKADRFLVKPIAFEELRALLSSLAAAKSAG